MKRALPLAVFACSLAAAWAADAPPRPRVTGLSHVAFRVTDVAKAQAFYQTLLGYKAAPRLDNAGRSLRVAVSDRQYVSLYEGLDPTADRLDHLALVTDDAEAMRGYLAARGVDVPPLLGRDESGNKALLVRDPEGRTVEFVEHAADTWPRRAPAAGSGEGGPVSRRIMHAGIVVTDLPAADRFYGDLLGLAETWRGSRTGTELSWTNMKVPDGEDYLEFMLHGRAPAPDARGTAHHICLEVADLAQAQARLAARTRAAAYTRPLEPRVGINRKRQLNLFDADGTRVELMEPVTVDGQPVPPSTAPPPNPSPR
jgi:lactoylglutathione lyase